jgi:hypothetical protein
VAKQRKNINKGVTLYNKILKEFTRINNTLPEDRKLSLDDRRRYIKENIYPQYKGTPASRVGIRKIQGSITEVVERIIPKEGCDVNFISPSTTADIGWFELDDYIRDVLPKCIYIRIDANGFGNTKIFNTLNYNYVKSGVRQIVENLREFVNREIEEGRSIEVSLTGVKKLRRGKTNDGTPENYYIDFILTLNSIPIKPLEPVIYNLPREQRSKATSVKNAILQRVKELNNKKKRRKNARKTAIKNISEVKKINKRLKNAKSPDFKRKLALQKIRGFLKAEKQIEASYRKGNLSQDQYDKFIAELKKSIEIAKKQGGII